VAAGGPAIKDTLYWGLSASGLDTDGYMENSLTGADDVGDDRHVSARGTLRWTPNEDLSVSFFMDGRDQDKGVANLRFEDGPFATDRFKVVSNGPDRSGQDSLGQALRINYRGKIADITSITAHQRFNRDMIMDFDRSPVSLGHALVDLTQDSWSQEFRLSGSREKLDWLGGVYAGRETLDNTWALDHVNPAMANRRISNTTTESLALFGQSTLSLTDRFKATAGLRLDHYQGEGRQVYTQSGTSQIFDKDLSQTQWLPMVALSYALTDRIDGYLTYSTGWLAGGYDYYSATSRDTFTYDPEYTQNYEAGIKADFFNNRLKTNLSVFYTDIEDKQVKEEVPGGGAGVWKYTNAARAHTQGVELEVTAMPTGNLEIFGGVGYAQSQVDDWTGWAGGQAVDYSGKQLPWAPELTANVGIGYYMENGIYTVADVFWAGRQYFDAANTLEDGGYELVNLKAGYRFNAFDISFWCRNLFDRKYA
ncbi:MAG: TonB-dependent receptor, partial [Desulfobacterales bacterium]|nr:TonB-dependent receptor [Desulfobacterales bacterium]